MLLYCESYPGIFLKEILYVLLNPLLKIFTPDPKYRALVANYLIKSTFHKWEQK